LDVNEEISDGWFEDIYINGIPQGFELKTTIEKREEE
jgi:hypothetical protein